MEKCSLSTLKYYQHKVSIYTNRKINVAMKRKEAPKVVAFSLINDLSESIESEGEQDNC